MTLRSPIPLSILFLLAMPVSASAATELSLSAPDRVVFPGDVPYSVQATSDEPLAVLSVDLLNTDGGREDREHTTNLENSASPYMTSGNFALPINATPGGWSVRVRAYTLADRSLAAEVIRPVEAVAPPAPTPPVTCAIGTPDASGVCPTLLPPQSTPTPALGYRTGLTPSRRQVRARQRMNWHVWVRNVGGVPVTASACMRVPAHMTAIKRSGQFFSRGRVCRRVNVPVKGLSRVAFPMKVNADARRSQPRARIEVTMGSKTVTSNSRVRITKGTYSATQSAVRAD